MNLFLYKLQLFGFEQLFWNTLRVALGTQTKLP